MWERVNNTAYGLSRSNIDCSISKGLNIDMNEKSAVLTTYLFSWLMCSFELTLSCFSKGFCENLKNSPLGSSYGGVNWPFSHITFLISQPKPYVTGTQKNHFRVCLSNREFLTYKMPLI